MPFCSGVGVSRTDSSTDTSRVASSVDVSEGHDGGEGAEGVVGAAGSGDTSGVHCCFPLANVVGKLTLVSNLGSPPLGSSRGARDKSGNVSRGDGKGRLTSA